MTEPSQYPFDVRRYSVVIGFVLMFALTWPLELGLAAQSRGLLPFHIPPYFGLFVGFGFVAAAIVATSLTEGRRAVRDLFGRLLVWRVSWIWYAIALFGPSLFFLLGILIHIALGGATPDFSQPFIRQLVPPSFNLGIAAIVFLLFQVFVNGEEFGWRGYALPRLQARHSSLIATLIVGSVATFWHVPKYLTVGDPHVLPFWFFALHTTMTAIFFTWIFNKTSGSLLLVILLHAGNNTGIVMLPIMPASVGDSRPLVLAYVLQMAAAAVLVALTGKHLGLTGTIAADPSRRLH